MGWMINSGGSQQQQQSKQQQPQEQQSQQQQQQPQQQQPQQSHGQPQQSSDGSGVPVMSHKRRPRGSAGTFRGKRPPKNPAKLAVFLAEKEVWDQRQEEEKQKRMQVHHPKKEPTEKQMQYRDFMRERLQDDNSNTAFQTAIQEYRHLMTRPAAAASNAHDRPAPERGESTPKKKQRGEAATTPDKVSILELLQAPRSASSSTASSSTASSSTRK